MPSPARWHVRTRYTYDLATGEWEVTELRREFEFDPGLLVDAEFERIGARGRWDEAIDRVQAADDPGAVFDEEMLDVIREEFRRRAGLD